LGAAAADDGVFRTDVYTRGADGYHTFRIPAVLQSRRGTLLAFCEGRKTSGRDHGDVDLVVRRSSDGGRIWSPLQIVYEEGGDEEITIGNPVPVEDRTTGVLWLAFCRNNKRVFVTRSDDDGLTWDKPVEITEHVAEPEWYWIATGPGHGIQLQSGRLVIPTDAAAGGKAKAKYSFAIFSDDQGRTWQSGAVVGDEMNECQIAERADGSLLLSMRNYLGQGKRAFATSSDGGTSWTEPTLRDDVPCPVCEAGLLRVPGPEGRLLYSGPAEKGRRQLTLRLSDDGGRTWPTALFMQPK
jgi:sialidase-1